MDGARRAILARGRWLRACCTLLAASILAPDAVSSAEPDARAVILSMGVQGDERRTRLTLEIDRPVRFDVYTLAAPYRIVVDVNRATFAAKLKPPPTGRGLITGIRHEAAGPDRSRIVIATRGPVVVDAANVFRAPGERTARLDIDLIETAASSYRVAAPSDPAPILSPELPAATAAPTPPPPAPVPRMAQSKVQGKPVIVIDPGHGGIDPGALNGEISEKSVVLAVARLVKAKLEAHGQLGVVLTRDDDTFVSLGQRVSISRRAGAHLFVSLHADSLAGHLAQSVRGATIYTLSETASSEEARLLAEKENAADALGGLESRIDEDDAQIKGILIDLVRREAAQLSVELRGRLLPHIRRSIGLSREPSRSAAFKVLRQADVPAVLIELGYMSNTEDAQLLTSPQWQRRIAGSIAAAVEEYFAHRSEVARGRLQKGASR